MGGDLKGRRALGLGKDKRTEGKQLQHGGGWKMEWIWAVSSRLGRRTFRHFLLTRDGME